MRIALLTSVLLVACGSRSPAEADLVPGSYSLRMDRRSSIAVQTQNGLCNAYSIELNRSGKLHAERSCFRTDALTVSGNYSIEKQLTQQEVAGLTADIMRINFFSYADVYGQGGGCDGVDTDAADAKITIFTDSLVKVVDHDHGCILRTTSLEPLSELENTITKLAGVDDWNNGQP